MRDKGLGAHFLALMTYEKGDPIYETRDGLLAFLVDGSSKLGAHFSVLHLTCYNEAGKLLVVGDIPFCAKIGKVSIVSSTRQLTSSFYKMQAGGGCII